MAHKQHAGFHWQLWLLFKDVIMLFISKVYLSQTYLKNLNAYLLTSSHRIIEHYFKTISWYFDIWQKEEHMSFFWTQLHALGSSTLAVIV